MNYRQWFLAGVVGSSLLFAACAARADVTFLHHFNDSSSFDINPVNDDFAAGSGVAAASGSPDFSTGFFPSSTPTNSAAHLNADFEKISYSASGNVQTTSPTTGGITVGTWFKQDALERVSWLFTIGAAGRDDDYLSVDFGAANTNILRALFRDGDGSNTTSLVTNSLNVTNWHYVATSVDLTNSMMSLYVFDSAGALVGGSPLSTAITVNNWNVPSGTINIGERLIPDGVGTQSVDEFSIDNVVLSQSELQARVNDYVAGNQLIVPEPATLGLVITAGLLLITRRRRA